MTSKHNYLQQRVFTPVNIT